MDLEIAQGTVQLINTIVHFPATIVIQAGVLEAWVIVTVNVQLLTPFALVRHVAHTLANPVSALRSPRGFLTQPLEHLVLGDWPLPHWNQAVHIVWECALRGGRFAGNHVPFTEVTFVEKSVMENARSLLI